jgi:LysR family glycine cleavage system transcriptional activator
MNLANRRSSLRGLRTFCTAARYRSFRLAAEELHVTASAVSHQIKNLEEELNLQLFERRSRTLELTPEGEQLYAEISPVMDQVDTITSRFRAPYGGRQLRISAQPFFASEFFLPRLQEFTALNPGIEIYVDTSDESSEKHPATIDVSIRLFRSTPANLNSDPLFPLRLVPACSPGFLKRFKGNDNRFAEPFPVVLHANRPSAWSNWMKSAGVDLPEPSQTIKVDSMIGVARAAERGLGAALVPMPLSENWFKSGALVQMFDHEVVLDDIYYFVSDKSHAQLPDVQALRAWVLGEFANAS